MMMLGAALAVGGCGATASDAADVPLTQETGAAVETAARAGVAMAAAPAGPAYRAMTLPAGTTLPLSLTSTMASDASAVEDAVTAELTRSILIDGREVLAAGTKLTGNVTAVDRSGRMKGRAMITFRFTSLETGGERYDVWTTALSHLAPATTGGDATMIGIGTGADVTSQLSAPLTIRVRII